MDVTPLIPKSQVQLNGYGGGGFKINNEQHAGSRFFTAEAHHAWDVSSKDQLDVTALQSLEHRCTDIDIMLIGTGPSMLFLDESVRQYFRERNIALEVMDTGAACRTFNVLQSEGRRVAAALIAV